jgi:hypothetical protein
VLAAPEDRIDADFPSPFYFDHMIAVLPAAGLATTSEDPIAGGYLFVDPTQSHGGAGWLHPAVQDQWALVLRGERSALVRSPLRPELETERLTVELAVRPDGGAAGQLRLELRGGAAAAGIERRAEERPEATDAEARRITTLMRALLRDCRGRILSDLPTGDYRRIRVLEKTPKNSLRVAYLSALFPDSFFIYIYRDPNTNIASLIDGWNSIRFNTYQINGRPWKFLLPPNWSSLIHRPVEEIAAAQWQSANTAIMDDLSGLPDTRWVIVTYDQLIGNPSREIHRICQLTGVQFDARAREMLAAPLPHSRSTLTSPDPSKWLRHRPVLDRMMHTLVETDLRAMRLLLVRYASGYR